MARRVNDLSVWDFSNDFRPELVGQALKRLWSFDGNSLSPAVDASGEIPHCPLTLEPLEVPVFLADGCVYECMPILQWLRTNDRSSLLYEPPAGSGGPRTSTPRSELPEGMS